MSTSNSQNYAGLKEFTDQLKGRSDFKLAVNSGGYLSLQNSGRRGGEKEFNLGIREAKETLENILEHLAEFKDAQEYSEGEWRDFAGNYFSNLTTRSLATVQTKAIFTTLSKLIEWANEKNPQEYSDNNIELSEKSLRTAIERLNEVVDEGTIKPSPTPVTHSELFPLPERLRGITHALLAKPFVILTGISGSGKTKLGEAVAEYFAAEEGPAAYARVAVGADWTDNRNVLGFVNHLREIGGRPVYQSTPTLDLILEAGNHPERPCFLILDEMNLSHVERYFADFLSVMEQQDGSFALHSEGCPLPRFSGDTVNVPSALPYPRNLFIIGTVNIDETTYMFSPKVLDRANVIEFGIQKEEIQAFLHSPANYPAGEKATAEVAGAFMRCALLARNGELEAPAGTAGEKIPQHLTELFEILRRSRFEFAYRTAKEISWYLRVCRHAAADKTAWDNDGWRSDLDTQILQKLLPKIHGSVGRIGGLLRALAHYCRRGSLPVQGTERADSYTGSDPAEDAGTGEALFPESLRKIRSMSATAREEQFVSFIN